MKNLTLTLSLTALLVACSGNSSSANTTLPGITPSNPAPDAPLETLSSRAGQLAHTVNFGNALEAPQRASGA